MEGGVTCGELKSFYILKQNTPDEAEEAVIVNGSIKGVFKAPCFDVI